MADLRDDQRSLQDAERSAAFWKSELIAANVLLTQARTLLAPLAEHDPEIRAWLALSAETQSNYEKRPCTQRALYFVVLRTQTPGTFVPMSEDGFHLATFATAEEAAKAGNTNIMGKACGAKIFHFGDDGEES
jgi:hypothetical protein